MESVTGAVAVGDRGAVVCRQVSPCRCRVSVFVSPCAIRLLQRSWRRSPMSCRENNFPQKTQVFRFRTSATSGHGAAVTTAIGLTLPPSRILTKRLRPCENSRAARRELFKGDTAVVELVAPALRRQVARDHSVSCLNVGHGAGRSGKHQKVGGQLPISPDNGIRLPWPVWKHPRASFS